MAAYPAPRHRQITFATGRTAAAAGALMTSWKRTFIAAFVAQIISTMGFSLAFPFLPFFLADLGIAERADRAWWAGLLQGLSGITLAISAPIVACWRTAMGANRWWCARCWAVRPCCSPRRWSEVSDLVVLRLLQGTLTGTVSASITLVAGVVLSGAAALRWG